MSSQFARKSLPSLYPKKKNYNDEEKSCCNLIVTSHSVFFLHHARSALCARSVCCVFRSLLTSSPKLACLAQVNARDFYCHSCFSFILDCHSHTRAKQCLLLVSIKEFTLVNLFSNISSFDFFSSHKKMCIEGDERERSRDNIEGTTEFTDKVGARSLTYHKSHWV